MMYFVNTYTAIHAAPTIPLEHYVTFLIPGIRFKIIVSIIVAAMFMVQLKQQATK